MSGREHLLTLSLRENLKLKSQKAIHRSFVEVISRRQFPASAKVLSVSVGDGFWDKTFLDSVSAESIEITATDIVDCPVVDEARQQFRRRCHWTFVKVEKDRPLPFEDQKFDVIYHHDVIEHTTKPFLFLNDHFRLLKPGGLIFVGTPNLFRPANIGKLFLGKLTFPAKLGANEEIGDYIHVQEFTEWQLQLLLEEVGFRTVEVSHAFFGLHFLNVRFSDLPKSGIGKLFSQYLLAKAMKPL